MELDESGKLFKALDDEREKRKQLEEEYSTLQGLVRGLEASLLEKNEEIARLRKESESKICNLYMKLGNYKSQHQQNLNEMESLRSSVTSIKADYFKATDNNISNSSKIDELYLVITDHRNQINNLRNQITDYQAQVQRLENENLNLLRLIDIKKASKFIQTEHSAFSPIGLGNFLQKSFNPQSSLGSPHKSRSESYNSSVKSSTSKSLPLDYSLQKVKSQMLSLQKSKARIDLQMNLLSKISEE